MLFLIYSEMVLMFSRLTTTYGLSLLCYNLAVGASFSHVLVWHWAELKVSFSCNLKELLFILVCLI